ncbi:MAG TPA: aminotransferase class I/II-fold pyridoxal phosphate-dependent enzyme, partial [Archangium sp.]
MRGSGIRKVMELARQTPGCIHLEIGDPDFRTPAHVIEAAYEAARAGFTGYSATAGLASLRQALARKLQQRNGLEVTPEQILVGPGAVFCLAMGMMATLDPGDEVLLPDPGWPSYEGAARVCGARPVPYPLRRETGYQ